MPPTNRPAQAPPLFVTDDKFPDVIAQLQARGWKRFPHESFPKFDLKWTNYAKIAWSRVGKKQIVNHFHNAVVLSKKNEFASRVYGHNSHSSHSSSSAQSAVDAFYPRTLDSQKRDGGGDRAKLVAWFLYGRAVAVLLDCVAAAVAPQQGTSEIESALAYAKQVVAINGFFTQWSHSSDWLLALDVWSDKWNPLLCRRSSAEQAKAAVTKMASMVDAQEIHTLLDLLRELDVQFDAIAAGHGDVWICKPSNLSQGRGIHLVTDLADMLRLFDGDDAAEREKAMAEATAIPESESPGPPKTPSWILQKYIERPLLLEPQRLHKFDVRQWVLLTSLAPLRMFWYDKCYLRFCSQPFTLASTAIGDSFTHLSNFSIQKDAPSTNIAVTRTTETKTETETEEDDGEPFASMWPSSRLQEHLRQQWGRDVWRETIVPEMQHATRQAIASALPEMNQVGRGFEWLGLDFLVDASLRVWLLEVNVSPDVSHSTHVTADLVPDATRGVLDLVLGEAPTAMDGYQNGWVEM